MIEAASRAFLLLSLQRALLGNVRPALRQVSIEADVLLQVVRVRYEHQGELGDRDRYCLSRASTEVIADFASPWNLEEQYSNSSTLAPLAQIGYRRFEADHDA